MKYRKKPVVIEAVRFLHTDSLNTFNGMPVWLIKAMNIGTIANDKNTIKIKTLEGEMTANSGDWLIQGVKGEIYPCKPDIFEATYEAVDETENPNQLNINWEKTIEGRKEK